MNFTTEDMYEHSGPRYPEWLLIFRGAVGLIIALIGVLANSLIIIALVKAPQLRNATSFFIISLSVADLILCLLGLLINISRYADFKWMDIVFLCTSVPYLLYGNFSVSFLSVVMITINRYVKICHYSLYDRIYMPTKIAAMIALCWLFSYSLQIPTIFGVWGQFSYSAQFRTCDIIPDMQGRSSKQWIFILGFFFPCLSIVYCYTRILFAVFMAARRISKSELRVNAQSEAKRKREELKRTKMVFIIFVTFLACYLPIIIIKRADENYKYPGLHVLAHFLVNISAIINPFIYGIINQQYRQAYLNVFKSIAAPCRSRKSQSKLNKGSSSNVLDMEDVKNKKNNENSSISSTTEFSFSKSPIRDIEKERYHRVMDKHVTLKFDREKPNESWRQAAASTENLKWRFDIFS